MKELMQEKSMVFRIGPSLFSGWKALSHIPFELSRRHAQHPCILHRDDEEGAYLTRALRSCLKQEGISAVSVTDAMELPGEYDSIIAAGSGSVQRRAKQLAAPEIPLFSVLSDIQDCREAGRDEGLRHPDAVFIDPASFQPCITKLTADSALTALAVCTEALQQDRIHSLLYSIVRTGLKFLHQGAPWDGSMESRLCTANACAAAALVRSNSPPGAVTSVSETLHASAFCLRSEASAALLPPLVQSMVNRQCSSLEILSRETGDGAAYILDILEGLRTPSGCDVRQNDILHFAFNTFQTSKKNHAGQILDLFSTIDEGAQS